MKEKKYLILGIVSTLVLMLGFSLAYFAPQIIGEGKKMTVKTANLEIIFTDTSEIIIEETIKPGWETVKTFTVENKSNNVFYYNINIKKFINTFVTKYLEYKITSENGYNMEEYKQVPKSLTESKTLLRSEIAIEEGETHTYTIYFRYVNDKTTSQNADMGKKITGALSIEEYKEETLYSKLLEDNKTILTRTDFDNVFNEENTGTLYKASGNETEDGSDVYYFAGNAQYNWVKFGKDQDGADLYWRIIRTNEDGGVRLLYIGPDPATESAFISIDGTLQNKIAYNSTSDNTMYVGYMYGEEGSLENNRQNTTSSNIKLKTDEWYSKTLNVKTDEVGNIYDSYISKTAIYCNDRSGDGYKSNTLMYYGAANRLFHNETDGRKPSYKCGYNASGMKYSGSFTTTSVEMYSDASVADKFSVSTASGGNGNLQYPIAQITADEVVYAGGKAGISGSKPWYYYNSVNDPLVGQWWPMTPSDFSGSSAHVFYVSKGIFSSSYVDSTSGGIRPVISLKSCVSVSEGNGSNSSPYEIKINSTCVEREN